MKYIALDKAIFFNKKVSIFFLFLNKNICSGYAIEASVKLTERKQTNTSFHYKKG